MSVTSNLLLNTPTPGDPAYTDTWGANVTNLDFTLIDSAVAGILSLSVAGSANVVLTSNQAAADQARNQHFNFTGVLTGNIYVLWPNGLNRMFSVSNNTTGAFTLSCGVTDGMGSPAGSSVEITRLDTILLYSDGTNVKQRAMGILGPQGDFSIGGDLTVGGTTTLQDTLTVTGITNAKAVSISAFSLTGANSQSIIDLSGTWNTSGTPTGVKLNITDTASNTASLLLALQVASANKFSVSKAGNIASSGTGTVGSFFYLPAQPRFQASWSSSFTAVEKITGMAETIDVGGNFTTSRFTVPSGGAGDYLIEWSVQNEGSPSTLCTIELYKNGVSAGAGAVACNVGFATGHQTVILSLVDADYLELYVTGGTCHSAATNNKFSGLLIG